MPNFTENKVLKQILADSFGGVMFNVANKDKYDTTELLKEWNNLSADEKNNLGGGVNGAMRFIQGN